MELLEQLDEKLKTLHYSEADRHGIPNVSFVSYIKNPQTFKVRNLCAVLDLPDDTTDQKTAQRFFDFVRKSLLDKYGEALLWKELEVSLVIICGHELFEIVYKKDGKMIHEPSFAMSSIMGACFIDRQTYDHISYHTFGLFFSSDHFKAIDAVVTQFCNKQKNP